MCFIANSSLTPNAILALNEAHGQPDEGKSGSSLSCGARSCGCLLRRAQSAQLTLLWFPLKGCGSELLTFGISVVMSSYARGLMREMFIKTVSFQKGLVEKQEKHTLNLLFLPGAMKTYKVKSGLKTPESQ